MLGLTGWSITVPILIVHLVAYIRIIFPQTRHSSDHPASTLLAKSIDRASSNAALTPPPTHSENTLDTVLPAVLLSGPGVLQIV